MSQLANPVQVVGQDLYTTSTTQNHVLGDKVVTPDGRSFRYVKVGVTALVPGKLYEAPAEDTSNFQNLTATATAVGDRTVTTTTTVTVTANQLAGGMLVVASATAGAGTSYRIKSHPAATAAVVTITLEDPIHTAMTGTVKIDMHPAIYNGVIIHATTSTSAVVGAAVYPVAAASFGWLQTAGPAPILVDDQTVVVGTNLAASNQAAGACEPHTGVQQIIGQAMTGGATTDYVLVKLNLDA